MFYNTGEDWGNKSVLSNWHNFIKNKILVQIKLNF